jgi:SAM-dependent methyltransferase
MLKRLLGFWTEQIDGQDKLLQGLVMKRLDILKLIAKKINAQTYLEIGVDTGEVFLHLDIPHKIGVDPSTASSANTFLTSDDFFAINTEKFDLIFVDGLHHADQVESDIKNSLQILNDYGYIVCHDMLPPTELCQMVPRAVCEWTGDCWKAWVKIRSERDDLAMSVVDTDFGCGLIKRGQQKTISINCDLNYQNFCDHKQEWMNIVSVDEFIFNMESVSFEKGHS